MEAIEYERMHTAEDRGWWHQALRADVLESVLMRPVAPFEPILDSGCGTGGMLAALEGALPGQRLFGLDSSEVALCLARRKARAPLVLASANALPFGDCSLGVVLSLDVLYHQAVNPHRAVAEAHRCLRPGGRLIVNVAAYEWMRSSHDRQVHGARRFTRSSLARLLATRPFARIETRYRNSLLFPLMALRRKLLPPAEGESDVARLAAPLEASFRAFAALERAGRRLGLGYPFGGSVFAIATK